MAPLAFDEMITADNDPRGPYQNYFDWYSSQDPARLLAKSRDAENIFRKTGITFAVYGHADSAEKLIPFDIIPRIISGREWRKLAQGIEQRVLALNAFLDDIYHKQEIIKAGRIPRELIEKNVAFLPEMIGFRPPGGVYTHIVGIDIVRTGRGPVLRAGRQCPHALRRLLHAGEPGNHDADVPGALSAQQGTSRGRNYPYLLRQSLASRCPSRLQGRAAVRVLTPGIYNSAYYEHSFLADMMGVELVEGSDLRVIGGKVKMRTTRGYEAIDVLYRRVDDDFLDPLTFRPDSALGIPGIMDVYRAGNITIANAPGTGISDDKAIYSYMPEIVEFYTGRKALLENVPTWRCSEPDSLKYVLENLEDLVVKEVHGSGGYGMLVGPTASKKEIEPILPTSSRHARRTTSPSRRSRSRRCRPRQQGDRTAPRRPTALSSSSPTRCRSFPGGFTRVALKQGSLVVNSSQGGGTKDTWVLED
jgi:uncharacterized circularly permuted ATP-grasp superfamily protein